MPELLNRAPRQKLQTRLSAVRLLPQLLRFLLSLKQTEPQTRSQNEKGARRRPSKPSICYPRGLNSELIEIARLFNTRSTVSTTFGRNDAPPSPFVAAASA